MSAVAKHIAVWDVVLVSHQYDVCKKICYQCVCWWVWCLSEHVLCVFRELCPVSFLVVGKSQWVLL